MPGKIRSKEAAEAVLTFRLPLSLYRKLQQAAGGRSVSAEMRQRLEASLVDPEAQPDQPTCQLLTAISAMADALGRLEEDYREEPNPLARFPKLLEQAREIGTFRWHVSPYGFARFRRAIEMLLDALEPEGEALPSSDSSVETGAGVLAMMGASKMGDDIALRLLTTSRLLELRETQSEERKGQEQQRAASPRSEGVAE